MKKCPKCKRTYADESFSFCLADGALLSASYDPDATLIIPAATKSDSDELEHWNHQNPKKWIAKGYIDLDDEVTFRIAADAASCFGKAYRGLQQGWIRHPREAGKGIWFPKLFGNKLWSNRISGDGKTIWEKSESPALVKEKVDKCLEPGHRYGQDRIVFGHVEGIGGKVYSFKGEFRLDREATNYDHGLVWRRVSERVKTYPST